MLLIRLLVISIILVFTGYQSGIDNVAFVSPVKIPLLLSANFGESRIDHFHSGIDIKTQGVTGMEVVAADDGYIYRISVSPGGFGNALYIRHASGYSTVYGHLDRFRPDIESYVKDHQYEERSFEITLYPPAGMFPVKQGQLIAYSGNSGSSGGPHLHFEIRKSSDEKPLNPLLFRFNIKDNIPPVIEKLSIYPLSPTALVDGRSEMKKINVAGGNGNYYVPSGNIIKINGAAGFGIRTFDLLNDSYNRCAAYSINLQIDSTTVFSYVMDGFLFSESRYVNAHIDYETYQKDHVYYERTFVLPNDRLRNYKNLVNRGIYNFRDGRIHHARITVSDAYNNKSVLSFNIQSGDSSTATEKIKPNDYTRVMPYGKLNRFMTDNLYLAIPEGALYDTLYFKYSKTPRRHGMFSDIHNIHNRFTPLQKPFSLSIKPDSVPAGKESKMLLVALDENNSRHAMQSKWEAGYVSADVYNFGNYYVDIDTVPPVISPQNIQQGIDMTSAREIIIKITDDLSGIKSYEPSIDGKWALFEYDQKNDMLFYRFDADRISKGQRHRLELTVTDKADNSVTYKCDFTW